jgi:hypothetical protein
MGLKRFCVFYYLKTNLLEHRLAVEKGEYNGI